MTSLELHNFSSVNFSTILISSVVSVCIAVFLIDNLKSNSFGVLTALAQDLKRRANLPETVSNYRILRVAYIILILTITGYMHVYIHQIRNLIEAIVYMIISAALIPVFFIAFSSLFNICFEILAGIVDIICYICWVPYRLYKDRDNPDVTQFMMFFFWVLFSSFVVSIPFIVIQTISNR